MLVAYVLLAVAISTEVGATALLPRTDGFTDARWSVVVLAGYALAIALLAVVVKQIPVAVTYAIWAGAGTALVAVVGALWLKQPLNAAQIACLALIIVGVVGLNLTGTH
ncbi:MAG TPA: multidrug efflux SMR transporter [Segeticoccus sp.]|uniref:DMT family transporter n=1 Tax=Segeticoccus sp. TaxID=2706531 RepID=UPI002D7FEF36|nr:multidrug efflux SMR transporter [Segeticoccus sp.]HET8599455.1 multidrug efflux SMR transporter [Segeticoccus sp.]